MSTITRERIEQLANGNNICKVTREERIELARIALASLEAKPIGAFHISDQQVGGTTDYIKDGEWPIDDGIIEVYSAPPASLTLPDEVIVFLNHLEDVLPDEAFNLIDVKTWNNVSMLSRPDVYRAAMLQGADGNSPVIPDGWVACSERMPEQFVEVLVCTEDGGRYVAGLNKSMAWDDGDFFDDIQYVTHWMPLPAAP